MRVVVVGGADADHRSATSGEGLVGVEPRWRAVARRLDVVGDGLGVLGLAVIASRYSRDHTCVEDSFVQLAVNAVTSNAWVAKRATQDVGAVLQGKLDTTDKLGVATLSLGTHHLDGHDFGTRGDTRLGASRALTCHDASAVASMAVVVHGVVVVVDDIVAVVRIFIATIPHAVGNVDVVVVHACVEDGDDHVLASEACAFIIPNRRRVDFVDVPSDVFGRDGMWLLCFGDHQAHLVGTDPSHILALGK